MMDALAIEEERARQLRLVLWRWGACLSSPMSAVAGTSRCGARPSRHDPRPPSAPTPAPHGKLPGGRCLFAGHNLRNAHFYGVARCCPRKEDGLSQCRNALFPERGRFSVAMRPWKEDAVLSQ